MIRNPFKSKLLFPVIVCATIAALVHPYLPRLSTPFRAPVGANSTMVLEHSNSDGSSMNFKSGENGPPSDKVEYAKGRRHRGPRHPNLTA